MSIINIAISQNWQTLNDIPFERHHSNGFGFEGKGYILKGVNGADNEWETDEMWEYDIATDTWTETQSFPGPIRGFAIGDEFDNKYYYGFGTAFNYTTNNYDDFKDLWVFDPADNSWTQLPDCPCAGRYHPSLVAHNGKVYVAVGSSVNGDLNDFWEYDIETQIWTQKPNLPGGNRHHTFHFTIDSNIYVGGGHVESWYQFNPNTDLWTQIDNYPLGRVAGTQFQYKNMGYLLAGDDRFHDHVTDDNTFMRYNDVEDDWEELPNLPDGSRWACSSFVLDDTLYYFGGIDYTGDNANKMFKFDLSLLDHPNEDFIDTTTVDTMTVSIFDQQFLNKKSIVYPNPFVQNVFLKDVENLNNTKITIYNIKGKEVLNFNKLTSTKLNLQNLKKGVYFLQLEENGTKSIDKIIKL